VIGSGPPGISITPDSEFALVRFGPRRAFRASKTLRRSDSFELGAGLATVLSGHIGAYAENQFTNSLG
jgi:hypothetical protein